MNTEVHRCRWSWRSGNFSLHSSMYHSYIEHSSIFVWWVVIVRHQPNHHCVIWKSVCGLYKYTVGVEKGIEEWAQNTLLWYTSDQWQCRGSLNAWGQCDKKSRILQLCALRSLSYSLEASLLVTIILNAEL